MKHKKVAKLGIVFALVMSILTNSVGNMFAQQEEQIEEVTIENYENDIETKEEIKEEIKIAEEKDDSLEIEASLIEEKEEAKVQVEQEASYTLSKSKFYNIHAAYPDQPNVGRDYHTVKFTDEPLPAGVTAVDLSENGDGSVIGGIEGEGTNQPKLIVTTNTPGKKVKFPRDSSYLFVKFTQDNPDVGIVFLTRSVMDLSNVDTSEVTNMEFMFAGIQNLEYLDLRSFNTSNVTRMSLMFAHCKDLTEINLSSFDTSNVTTMAQMFAGCTALEELDLRNFNTSNVIDMLGMFRMCRSLKSLDLSSFNTSSVNDMSYMFKECNLLKTLDLGSFNTENVTTMSNMFDNCGSLRELNLSSFNTSKVTNMSTMFQDCTALVTLDLSNFNSLKTTNMNNMFKNCASLKTIYAEEWDTSKVANDMDIFLGCEQVVGKSEYAITTPFDPNRIGKEVATPNNGYFTVPNLEEWNATVKLVNEDNQVLATKDFLRTNRKPEITTENLNEFMPNGYELVDENMSLTVTQDGQVFEVEIRKIQWTLELEYQTEDGDVVKTEAIQVTQLNPVVTAQTITDSVPTGYELAEVVTDWTATINGDKKVIQVREIEWTISIEFVTENSRGVVETVTFTGGNLNPVIEAQQIMNAIPKGYYALNEIQDLRATEDGEVFQIVVVKIEAWEGIVHFVDQNGVTIKTEKYNVTNKEPIIRVEELEKAMPVEATLVNPLTELTVTKDKEEFIIEVIMPVEEKPGIDDDTTTDAEQPEGSVEGAQTGDTTQMGLWTILMGGSVGVLVYLKRKKRNI